MKKIVNPWRKLAGYNCFGCSPDNEYGVKMEFYEDGDEVVSIWKPDCGWVVFRKLQTAGMTTKMETRFRKSVSTDASHLVLRASLKEQKRNLAFVEARLYNDKGELCTETLCTYFTFPKEKAEKEMFFRGCEVEPEELLPLI